MTQQPVDQEQRDSKTGRFVPGVSGNPNGRPTLRSLTEALRDVVDPDEAAALLKKRMGKSDTVLMYVFNRLEGQPKQATEVEHKGKVDVSLKWEDGSDA